MNKTMNQFLVKIGLCIALLFIISLLSAQQVQYRSPLSQVDFAFNPGMTAAGQTGHVGAFHRQQWLSFEGAPQTSSAFGQFPILYEKMSGGLYVRSDEEGAFQTTDISLSYNYKMELGFFRNDQLSVGISGGIKQNRFDNTRIAAQSTTDPTIAVTNGTDTRPQFGAGFFYVSDKDMFSYEENAFYLGVGGTQLIPFKTDIFVGEGYRQTIHTNAILGAKFINNFLSFRPEVWVDYALNAPIQGTFSLTMELEDIFWIGASFQTDRTVSLFAGGIIKTGDYRRFRIGALWNYNIGLFSTQRGFGYEGVFSYEIDI